MRLRLATPTDLPALMALIRGVVPQMQAMGNRQWDATYPNEKVLGNDIALGQLWVAEADGTLAGVAALTTHQEPEYAEVGWDLSEPAIVVHRLAVAPAFQGQGVAGRLMHQAEVVARERGIRVMRLDTNTQNPVTQRLLPKLGYTPAGEIGLSYRPGLRFLCYEKQLDKAVVDKPAKAIPREVSLKGTASAVPQNTSGKRGALAPEGDLHRAALALGSNLTSPFGPPDANLREAVKRLASLGTVSAVSSFYWTAPVGVTEQPDFVNAAALLLTDLQPLGLMRELLAIERAMGRDRITAISKGPRIIDLDLLLIDDVVLATPELTLPHPAMAERRFVLEPLAEIAPTLVHPVTGETVRGMLVKLSG